MRYPLPTAFLAALLATLVLAACSSDPKSVPDTPDKGGTAEKPDTPAEKPAPVAKPTPKAAVVMPDKTPAVFKVKFTMTCGDCVIECRRDWAPKGADRFFEMVKSGFFEDIGIFRVIPNFMAQFGIHGDPNEADKWSGMIITDDPVTQSNVRGMLSFATRGKDTRTTQMFINYKDNSRLDAMGFSPFAKVVEGMDVVDNIFKIGERPNQGMITAKGNAYLKQFPDLDYIKSATYLGGK
jgi:cyclophilin family peptidyl-prolyl cis-trans isomerase